MSFRGMHNEAVSQCWSPAVIMISNKPPAWLKDESGAIANRLYCEIWDRVDVDRSTNLGTNIKSQIQPLLALLLKSFKNLRDHVQDVLAMNWDFEPMKRWSQQKPALFTAFLRCGEFIAANGDKYVLTFTMEDKTPVPEAQEIYKLWLEDKRKTDDGSGAEDRIAAAIASIDALSMPMTAKIHKCHECKEMVAADGEESNCQPGCEDCDCDPECPPACTTQCPGGAWLSKYGAFRVGKDPRTCQLFGTSWACHTLVWQLLMWFSVARCGGPRQLFPSLRAKA